MNNTSPVIKNSKKFLANLGWPIFIIGILTTTIVTCYIYKTGKDEDRLRFDYEVDQAMSRILYRMDRYEGALIQARSFFISSNKVTSEEFGEYFRNTNIVEKFPGIKGLGYAQKVEASELADHLAKNKKRVPGYHIWPEYKRDVYFSILFIEPADKNNRLALGYDMYTDPVRHEAMQKAWETGMPAISGKIILVQELKGKGRPGFNLYVPYYQSGKDNETLEGRKKNLLGFIYSPFTAEELFISIFPKKKSYLNFDIFDGLVMEEKHLMFRRQLGDDKHAFSFHDLSLKKNMRIAGRDFTLFFTPSDEFKHKYTLLTPIATALVGLLISLLIFRLLMLSKKQAELGEASEKALQEAIEARDEFLSIASHELKTPLTSLRLQAQMIMRSLDKTDSNDFPKDKVKVMLEQTDRQTHRLNRLVDDMLDISRIRSGKLKIEKEEFSLCELIKDVIARMREQFQNIPGGEPELKLCSNDKGSWDKFRIEQVITNLLTNAIKYGNNRSIEIEVAGHHEKVILKVTDHGIGIADEYQSRIFNRFERAGLSATEIGGLGLGLFITKRIVDFHGGMIHFESKVGKGTTFIIELPKNA